MRSVAATVCCRRNKAPSNSAQGDSAVCRPRSCQCQVFHPGTGSSKTRNKTVPNDESSWQCQVCHERALFQQTAGLPRTASAACLKKTQQAPIKAGRRSAVQRDTVHLAIKKHQEDWGPARAAANAWVLCLPALHLSQQSVELHVDAGLPVPARQTCMVGSSQPSTTCQECHDACLSHESRKASSDRARIGSWISRLQEGGHAKVDGVRELAEPQPEPSTAQTIMWAATGICS